MPARLFHVKQAARRGRPAAARTSPTPAEARISPVLAWVPQTPRRTTRCRNRGGISVSPRSHRPRRSAHTPMARRTGPIVVALWSPPRGRSSPPRGRRAGLVCRAPPGPFRLVRRVVRATLAHGGWPTRHRAVPAPRHRRHRPSRLPGRHRTRPAGPLRRPGPTGSLGVTAASAVRTRCRPTRQPPRPAATPTIPAPARTFHVKPCRVMRMIHRWLWRQCAPCRS